MTTGPYRKNEKSEPDMHQRFHYAIQHGAGCALCQKGNRPREKVNVSQNESVISLYVCADCRDSICDCYNCFFFSHGINGQNQICMKRKTNFGSLCYEWKQRYPIDFLEQSRTGRILRGE